MSDSKSNPSSITMTKQDGSPITFNFQLENGLPYKPIIKYAYKTVQDKITNQFAIYSYLSNEEIIIFNQLQFTGNLGSIKNGQGELWLISDSHYVVFENLSGNIVQELKNKNLGFCFFNEKEEFIRGFKIG